MSVPAPHFLLYAEAALAADSEAGDPARWRFVLRSPDGAMAAEAADDEPAASRERLELLAVIRGLEALDQPSRVTLMTGSRHLQCGLESGLAQWRDNNWHWERYGRMTPIKNADLWRRLDRLVDIHSVRSPQARVRHSDDLAPPVFATTRTGRKLRIDAPSAKRRKHEIRNAKHESNSKFELGNAPNRPCLGVLKFALSKSLRVSCFVLRAFITALLRFLFPARLKPATRSPRPHVNSRGVSRAHDRLPRRHERPARRLPRPPTRCAGAADDPA